MFRMHAFSPLMVERLAQVSMDRISWSCRLLVLLWLWGSLLGMEFVSQFQPSSKELLEIWTTGVGFRVPHSIDHADGEMMRSEAKFFFFLISGVFTFPPSNYVIQSKSQIATLSPLNPLFTSRSQTTALASRLHMSLNSWPKQILNLTLCGTPP